VSTRHIRRLVHERRIPFDAPMDRQVAGGGVPTVAQIAARAVATGRADG
jgi:hypothetical protein